MVCIVKYTFHRAECFHRLCPVKYAFHRAVTLYTNYDVSVGLPKPGIQLSDRFAAGVNINQVIVHAIFIL